MVIDKKYGRLITQTIPFKVLSSGAYTGKRTKTLEVNRQNALDAEYYRFALPHLKLKVKIFTDESIII